MSAENLFSIISTNSQNTMPFIFAPVLQMRAGARGAVFSAVSAALWSPLSLFNTSACHYAQAVPVYGLKAVFYKKSSSQGRQWLPAFRALTIRRPGGLLSGGQAVAATY